MEPISSNNIKEILEQMANSLSEWVYSHRLTTRHEARKSSVRICFILAKQANRNANYFSAKQKLL